MKHFYTIKSLMLVALLAFCSNAMAETHTYTYIFDGVKTSDGQTTQWFSDAELKTAATIYTSTNKGTTAADYYYKTGEKFTFCAGNGYYFSSQNATSASYFMIGKTDAYVTLPTYTDQKITKVTVTGSTGHSKSVSVNIMDKNGAASTAQTWSTTGQTHEYTIAAASQSETLRVQVTNAYNCQWTQIVVETSDVDANEIAVPTIAVAGELNATQTVTISQSNNYDIYYTTDGTDPTSSATAQKYVSSFEVSSTTTVKAAANKDDNWSEIAEKLVLVAIFSDPADVYKYATSSNQKITFTFSNIKVTGVNGKNAYASNGTNGFILYNSAADSDLNAGDVINGTLEDAGFILYNGAPEITGFSTTELDITTGGTVTYTECAISDLSVKNQSMAVKLLNVTYDATNSKFVDESNKSIAYYNGLNATLDLVDGRKYNVEGVVNYRNALQLFAVNVESLSTKDVPTASWNNSAAETVQLGGSAPTLKYTTDSDGAVTYTSSHPEVATIAADGTITVKNYGVTVLSASTAATDSYEIGESMTATLTVTGDGVEILTASFIGSTAYADWTKTGTIGSTINGNTSTSYNAIQMRSSGNSGIVLSLTDKVAKTLYIGYNTNTASGRRIDIYGADSYSSAADLYSNSAKGTKDGSVTMGDDPKYDLTDNYGAIGIRSYSSALYVDYIVVVWADGYTREVTEGNFGTICLAQNATVTGADVFEIAGTRLKEGEVSCIVLEAVESLEAGKAYIFQATSAKISAFMTGTAVTAAATDGAIVGNLSDESVSVANGNYVISQNKIRKVNGGTATVGKNRAYLNLSGVAEYQEPSETTTKRTVELDVAGSTTAISEINADVNNSVMFDLSGRRVNKMDKGIYIVNGKKVIVR